MTRHKPTHYFRRKLLALVEASPLRACLSLVIGSPRTVLLFLGLTASVSGAFLMAPPTLAKMNASTSPPERATAYSYYKTAYVCVREHMRMEIRTVPGENGATAPSQGDKNLNAGGSGGKYEYEWFRDQDAWVTAYPEGKRDCYQAMQKMLELTGLSGKDMLKAIGYKWNEGVPRWENPPSKTDGFRQAVLDKVGNVNTLNDNASKHFLYLNAFTNKSFGKCEAKQISKYSSADSTVKKWADQGKVDGGVTYVKVKLAEGTTTVDYIYTYKPSTSGDLGGSTANYGASYAYRGATYAGASNSEVFRCADLPKLISDTANAVKAYNEKNGDKQVDSRPGESDTPGDGEGNEAVSCAIDGIGWLVCPVVNFLAGIADLAYEFLADNFLATDVRLIRADNSNPAYVAWRVFQRYANILLVIAFLVIIYSQLTSFGISNYGIKKMLPRIMIAAVLINLSFIVCQLAVDLSNLLGYGLKTLLSSVGGSDAAFNVSASGALATGDGWVGIAGTVLTAGAAGAAGVAAAGGITLALVALIGMLIAAVIALIMIFFILVIRQVLIVLLIVLAPLAFAAYLLPNTEQWFTKWRKVFVAMLMLFPIIGVVFGASTLASKVVTGLYADTDNILGQIVGAGILVLPLFVVPGLLKKSIDAVGSLGGKLNGLSGKWGNGARGKLKATADSSRFGQARDFRKQQRAINRQMAQGGTYTGRNPLRRMQSGTNAWMNERSKYGGRLSAKGVALANKEEAEEIGNEEQRLNRSMFMPGAENNTWTDLEAEIGVAAGSLEGSTGIAATALQKAMRDGDSVKARAAFSVLQGQGAAGVEAARAVLAQNAESSVAGDMREHILEKHIALKGKDHRITSWAEEGNPGNLTQAGHMRSLTDAQVASQTAQSITAGDLDSARAQRILSDPQIQKDLKENQRAALELKAAAAPGRTNNSAPAQPGQPAQPDQAPTQRNDELHIDHPPRGAAPSPESTADESGSAGRPRPRRAPPLEGPSAEDRERYTNGNPYEQ